jgi:hypothetical protein
LLRPVSFGGRRLSRHVPAAVAMFGGALARMTAAIAGMLI